MKDRKINTLGPITGLVLLALAAALVGLLGPGRGMITQEPQHYGCAPAQAPAQTEPRDAVPDVRASIAVSVCGLAVTPNGTVWGWGDNSWGQLLMKWQNWGDSGWAQLLWGVSPSGLDSMCDEITATPRQVQGLPRAVGIAAGA